MAAATKKRARQIRMYGEHTQPGDWVVIGVKADGERAMLGGLQTQEEAIARAEMYADFLDLYETFNVEKMAAERIDPRRKRPRKGKATDQGVLS